MSRRIHPIDDAFRKKLKHHASEIPMNLWESIEHRRTVNQKIEYQNRQKRIMAALLLVGLIASVMSWYTRIQFHPELGSFPVSRETSPIAAFTAPDKIDADLPPSIVAANAIESLPQQRKNRPIPLASLHTPVGEATSISEMLPAVNANQSVLPAATTQVSALQLTTLPPVMPAVNTLKPFPIQASGCASFSGEKTKFYLEVMAAPGFADRSLDPRGSDYTAYANTRKETELPRYAYSAALRVSVVTEHGLALRTGVNYSEINERFEHTIENEVRTIITNIYGQNGEIIGTDTTIETTARQVVANNRYRTFDIPVLAGIEKRFKNVTLTLNGGAYINVMFRPKGEFLSPEDNRPVIFSNDSNNEAYSAFRENLGVGWYSSVGVQYRISPRLQLLMEPHLKAYPRSFTRDDFMTDQKYLTAGVFVGIRHQL